MQASSPDLPSHPASFLQEQIHVFAQTYFAKFEQEHKRKNTVYYHDCCCTFTMKHQQAKCNHSKSDSLTFWDFKRHHQVTDQATFETALLTIALSKKQTHGQTVPSFNQPHNTEPLSKPKPHQPLAEPNPEVERLQHENSQLRAELQDLRHRYTELQHYTGSLRTQLFHAKGQTFFNEYVVSAVMKWFTFRDVRLDLSEIHGRASTKSYYEAQDFTTRELEFSSEYKLKEPSYTPPVKQPTWTIEELARDIKIVPMNKTVPKAQDSALSREQEQQLFVCEKSSLTFKASDKDLRKPLTNC